MLQNTLQNVSACIRYGAWKTAWREAADYLALKTAHRLPRRLVYWSGMRMLADFTATEAPSMAVHDVEAFAMITWYYDTPSAPQATEESDA